MDQERQSKNIFKILELRNLFLFTYKSLQFNRESTEIRDKMLLFSTVNQSVGLVYMVGYYIDYIVLVKVLAMLSTYLEIP